jgi:hypothetical protein
MGGTLLTMAGGAIIGTAGQPADVALGALLIAVGQFLVLQGLITWSVSRGTQPLADELAGIRGLLAETAKRAAGATTDAAPMAASPAQTPPLIAPAPTPPAGWATQADRQHCENPVCSARGLRTSAYLCPACGARTTTVP